MRRFSIAALLLGSLAPFAIQSASAADMRPPAAPPAGAPIYAPPPFTWSGFYAGGNLGWGWSDGDGTFTIPGLGAAPVSGDGDGFVGGGQLGYNWQTGAVVFGIETDIQGSSGSGDLSGPGVTGTLKTPWFGTVRGRLGYANDKWLFYVTGGGVYGEADYDGTLATTGNFSASETYWTWTVGAGVEAMVWDRWSAKLEYLFVGTPSDFPTPPGTTAADGDISTSIVRAGLNYHF